VGRHSGGVCQASGDSPAATSRETVVCSRWALQAGATVCRWQAQCPSCGASRHSVVREKFPNSRSLNNREIGKKWHGGGEISCIPGRVVSGEHGVEGMGGLGDQWG